MKQTHQDWCFGKLRSNPFMTTSLDPLLTAADSALRTLFARPHATRATPVPSLAPGELSDVERREAGALMRVNHVGEVCAQALYTAQAAVARDPVLRAQLLEAAHEETDHLAWTRERLDVLGARPSVLNPLWYAGAFGLGLVAGRLGDPLSLGFVAETERQVEAHLDSHLDRLPSADSASRAVVEQMKADEARHAENAVAAGAAELPPPAKALMRVASRVMTTVAHRI
jgi:ubiquinone biosynthesis monooxygenase Coq7